jgi:hypothetical protein
MVALPERILEPDVDAELLRRNRLGESQAALADDFGCSKSLVQRRIARAKLAEERDQPRANGHLEGGEPTLRGLADDDHAPIQVRAEYERIVRESPDSRSVVAALKELERLDRESDLPRDAGRQLLAAIQRIRELEAEQFRLPRFMPGVEEWFDALAADVEGWTQLPGAPVELVDQLGDAHHVLPEDVWFFVEHLNWTTPPVLELDDDLIEEWRARIGKYDARRAQVELTALI